MPIIKPPIEKLGEKDLPRHLAGTIFISFCWLLAISLSLYWNLYNQNIVTEESARIEARTAFFKIKIFRDWMTQKEMVYAKVSGSTPPNPYLRIPEKNVRINGKEFTMVNPAYMTRQVQELQQNEEGVLGHITSLDPINPGNRPDPWEKNSLEIFRDRKKGSTTEEISDLQLLNDKYYMRLIKPLITDKSCQRCHNPKVYKIGSLRGGISVSIPMAKRYTVARSQLKVLITAHGIILILGLVGIGSWYFYGRRRITERNKNLKELHIRNTAIETSSTAIIITEPDPDNTISYVNKAFYTMWQYDESDEITGKFPAEIMRIEEINDIIEQINELGNWFSELKAGRKDGTPFFALLSASRIIDDKGRNIGIIFSFSDITMRKNTELDLKKSRKEIKERNDLIEKDLDLAVRVQKELLGTDIPSSDYLKIQYRYVPVEKLSGDYFTFFNPEEKIIGIFLGDVSGHGVAPALFHSLIKSSTDKACSRNCMDPSDFLQQLNTDLMGKMASYFVTGIYCVFMPDKKTGGVIMHFSNAGSPAPVTISSNGEASTFDFSSRMLGIDEKSRFELRTVHLGKGDRLFLFTDGVTETRDKNNEMIGDENRLPVLVKNSMTDELGGSLDRVIENLKSYGNLSVFKDDIVLIGVEII